MNNTSTQKTTSENLKNFQEMNAERGEEEFEPDQNVINTILNYSRSLSIKRSSAVGHIEMILN